jgi:hypothetical protein
MRFLCIDMIHDHSALAAVAALGLACSSTISSIPSAGRPSAHSPFSSRSCPATQERRSSCHARRGPPDGSGHDELDSAAEQPVLPSIDAGDDRPGARGLVDHADHPRTAPHGGCRSHAAPQSPRSPGASRRRVRARAARPTFAAARRARADRSARTDPAQAGRGRPRASCRAASARFRSPPRPPDAADRC